MLTTVLAAADNRGGQAVLCVGCRNTHELDLFRTAGYGSVVGVDLFSTDPRIRKMDMHALEFSSDSFDVIYSCHSLEHSITPFRAAQEFIRVARPGAACVIEVPIQFATSAVDRHDYGTVKGLRALFEAHVGDVLFSEEAGQSSQRVARLAFRVKKPAEPA